MTFQWYGQSYFKIQAQGKTPEGVSQPVIIGIDPFSKSLEMGFEKTPRFKADIALMTHDHPDHNNLAALEGEPLVFKNPGEYDAKGIYIRGLASFHDKRKGKDRGANTIFVIETEDLKVCHMGDFGEGEVGAELLEALGDIDVLLIPVGGKYTIDSEEAMKVIHQIGPKVVIPMHYSLPGMKLGLEPLEKFLKAYGAKKAEPEEKFSVKKKDLEENGAKLEILKPLAFD